jgi:hypothetical protein
VKKLNYTSKQIRHIFNHDKVQHDLFFLTPPYSSCSCFPGIVSVGSAPITFKEVVDNALFLTSEFQKMFVDDDSAYSILNVKFLTEMISLMDLIFCLP